MRCLGGWELKPYAFLHSRFPEVILLDADNLPPGDPASLSTGKNSQHRRDVLAGCCPPQGRQSNLGSLRRALSQRADLRMGGLVDKQRCWQALQLALFMNEHSDFYYRHVHGDKDTFFMAWLRLGQPFAMTPHLPTRFTEGLYQKDIQGRTVFQHRNCAKWAYGGKNPRVLNFQHEEACLALLDELQSSGMASCSARPQLRPNPSG